MQCSKEHILQIVFIQEGGGVRNKAVHHSAKKRMVWKRRDSVKDEGRMCV